jgi:hypothetical protein
MARAAAQTRIVGISSQTEGLTRRSFLAEFAWDDKAWVFWLFECK